MDGEEVHLLLPLLLLLLFLLFLHASAKDQGDGF